MKDFAYYCSENSEAWWKAFPLEYKYEAKGLREQNAALLGEFMEEDEEVKKKRLLEYPAVRLCRSKLDIMEAVQQKMEKQHYDADVKNTLKKLKVVGGDTDKAGKAFLETRFGGVVQHEILKNMKTLDEVPDVKKEDEKKDEKK